MRKSTRKQILCLLMIAVPILVLLQLMNFRFRILAYWNRRHYDPSMPGLPASKKLVIFDAENYSRDLSFLTKAPLGWVVIVTNVHSWGQKDSCGQCVFVSPAWAESYLKSEDTRGLSPSVKVKMATYLSLLAVEPDWVYVTNKAQEIPYHTLARVVDRQFTTSLVYAGPSRVFDPCRHFVDPGTLRRFDYPVITSGRYVLENITLESVYSMVDECFPSSIGDGRWKMALDQRAPIPFLLPGKFGVMDFNNLLLTRDALWTLVAALPDLMTRESKVNYASLKLNLVVQRILWETRHRVAFLPGEAQRPSCSTCTVADGMVSLGPQLLDLMVDWRWQEGQGITSCLAGLGDMLINDTHVASLLHTWIRYFNAFSRKTITRQPLTPSSFQYDASGRRLLFTPAKLTHATDGERAGYPPEAFRHICQRNGRPYKALVPARQPMTDLLLLIVVNEVQYVQNIPLLEYLYGRHFNRILYCSENIADFEKVYEKANPGNPVSYVTMPHSVYTQVCTVTAIRMGYDVTGYLQFSDDVLVNLWNYHNVPRNQPWFQHFMGVGHIRDEFFWPGNGKNPHYTSWVLSRSQMRAAWDRLQVLRTDSSYQQIVSRFFQTLSKSTNNCSTCIYFGNADIFYLPRHIEQDFAFLADFFDSYKIHFEIAIINAIGGLVPRDQIYRLSGKYAWAGERRRFKKFYKLGDQFYHAWKFSLLKNPENALFFCEQYLHNLDVDLKQLTQK